MLIFNMQNQFTSPETGDKSKMLGAASEQVLQMIINGAWKGS
jgi:hypothetical protein